MEKQSTHGVRIGVDTGGTFTDLILLTEQKPPRIVTHKLLSTPQDPAEAVINGIAQILKKAQQSMTDISRVTHGSTVATNALLEDTQARPVMITTAGFEDLLYLARQNRDELYALQPTVTPPPITRDNIIGMTERIHADGSVETPLTNETIRHCSDKLRSMQTDSVAIIFLHSYANPEHEMAIANAIKQHYPNLHLTISNELLPEFREYERAATCIINAAVAPKMNRYLSRLDKELKTDNEKSLLRIMASNGGAQPLSDILRDPVHTILSGPAGGVIGAMNAARASGITQFITLDIGGTSTDVALCDHGIARTYESEAGGLPVRLPTIDIHTVGAGGGSIAWKDSGGALRVGPRSAGADPGPVCYGKQSAPYQLTVTDANVYLNYLPRDSKLAGYLELDMAALEKAFEQYLADFPQLTTKELALGILKIADAAMARAVRRISVSQGKDPRQFTLLPFGGAGALQACRLAQSLGMTRVLIPHHPGLLSALGMTTATPRYDLSQGLRLSITDNQLSDDNLKSIESAYKKLSNRAELRIKNEPETTRCQLIQERLIDLRYAGQSFELGLPFEPVDTLAKRFHQLHTERYGHALPNANIEIINLRLCIHVPDAPDTSANIGTFKTRHLSTPKQPLQRNSLHPGDSFTGPAVITETNATTYLPPGWALRVDHAGQLLLTHLEGE